MKLMTRRVLEVRLIGAEGQDLGVMGGTQAWELADQEGLDLVEVNSRTSPPTAKLLDYGKLQYEASKNRKRSARNTVKEIKLRPKTDVHDLEVKVSAARRFLADGDQVQLTCRFRGREITHPEVADRQLKDIVARCLDVGVVSQPVKLQGRGLTCLISPRRPG